MLTPQKTFMLVLAVPLAACAPDPTTYPTGMDMTTWSIVGIDPKTGDVGVAVASCVTRQGDAVAALVPGKGAAATQAGFDIKNRNKVFEAIKQGLTAEEVIAQVTDRKWDSETDRRQYGVLTMHEGFVRAAGFTTPTRQGMTAGEDGVPRFAGVMADPSRGVSSRATRWPAPRWCSGRSMPTAGRIRPASICSRIASCAHSKLAPSREVTCDPTRAACGRPLQWPPSWSRGAATRRTRRRTSA